MVDPIRRCAPNKRLELIELIQDCPLPIKVMHLDRVAAKHTSGQKTFVAGSEAQTVLAWERATGGAPCCADSPLDPDAA